MSNSEVNYSIVYTVLWLLRLMYCTFTQVKLPHLYQHQYHFVIWLRCDLTVLVNQEDVCCHGDRNSRGWRSVITELTKSKMKHNFPFWQTEKARIRFALLFTCHSGTQAVKEIILINVSRQRCSWRHELNRTNNPNRCAIILFYLFKWNSTRNLFFEGWWTPYDHVCLWTVPEELRRWQYSYWMCTTGIL